MFKKALCFIFIFGCFMAQKSHAQIQVTKDTMSYYRKQIDTLDNQIINLLGQRMQAARAIGLYKLDHQIGVVQSERFNQVLESAIRHGATLQLSEKFVRALYNDIHKESIRQEDELQAKVKQMQNEQKGHKTSIK